MKPIRIVQSSFPRTGSTVLVNLIHGVLSADTGVNWQTATKIHDHLITKTHDTNIDRLILDHPDYDIYFVVSEREGKPRFDERYRDLDRVLFVDYEDLLETPDNSIEQIVLRFFRRLKNFLPADVFPPLSDLDMQANAVLRIRRMNTVCEKLKDKQFAHVDPFFHIHGSHRSRSSS